MAIPVFWRRLRWRGGDRGALLQRRLIAAVVAPLAVLALAPTALARPGSPAPSAALLPSVLPTVCVGGIVLCGGPVVTLPTSVPVPLPSVCVGPACTGEIIGTATPGSSPPVTTPAGGVGTTSAPSSGTPGGSSGPGAPVSVAAAALVPAPPGVGLVPPVNTAAVQDSFNPDAFATVLSLSLRDGLGAGRYYIWPWLLAIQLVLWTVIAGVAWSRQPGPSPRPRRD